MPEEFNPAPNGAITTQNLTRRFGDIVAVDHLTLNIEEGEIFGLLGPNGAGKTTTIRMLCALIGITEGAAWVAGHQVGTDDNQLRKNVGILTESPGLYDRLSAERNLGFYAEMHEVPDVAGQVERYLRMLGLWDRRHEPVGGYSKGMRQKIAIARALIHEPKVLFLDEPTAGLDPAASRLIREFIADLKGEGRTIVMCTHNLDEADRLCDRIAVFNSRLLALDTPTALRRKLYGRSVVFHLRNAALEHQEIVERFEFVQSANLVDGKLIVGLEEPDEYNPVLVQALVKAGAEIQFVGELRRRLEDVYLQLMKAEN